MTKTQQLIDAVLAAYPPESGSRMRALALEARAVLVGEVVKDVRDTDPSWVDPPLFCEEASPLLKPAAPDGSVEALKKHLRAFADNAYCRGIETLRRDECLGWETKAKSGKFGEAEMHAHEKANRYFGAHFGIHEALKTFAPHPQAQKGRG